MNEGVAHKLTLISAPAGFEKSTLASDWVNTHKIPAAWVPLCRGDSDPAQFFTYLILRLQILRKTTGKAALAMLHSSQPPPTETAMTNLILSIGVLLPS